MTIKAIAVDDEPLALTVLQSLCDKVPGIELEKCFTKPTEAAAYLAKFPVDLIFLDINMPSVNGIEFYKGLPKEPMVIFTTAYSEFAVEGFNLNAVDYLVKPFSLERFGQAVEKAQAHHQLKRNVGQGEEKHFFVRADYRLVKVVVGDITLIEGYDDYIKIHQRGSKVLVVRMTMRAIMDKLPDTGFLRIHRSYIVPISQVASVGSKHVEINGRQLPVGGSYEADVRRLFPA